MQDTVKMTLVLHTIYSRMLLLKVLPNFTIHNVTDNILARKFAEQSVEMTTPNYVRLERHVETICMKIMKTYQMASR